MSPVTLRRAQIGRGEGIDVTVKSAQGVARAFAPTWEMVMALKRGALSEEDYEQQYREMLQTVPLDAWRWLHGQGQTTGSVTVLCYCRTNWFCHTHLLIAYAASRWPRAFAAGS